MERERLSDDFSKATRIVDWRSVIYAIERWLGRLHLLWWLTPTSIVAVITAAVGILGQAPFYLLIPAVLAAAVYSLSLMERLRSMYGGMTRTSSPKPSFSVIDFAASIDFTDHHAKLSFTPIKNIARLRIRLDQSNLIEGVLGGGNMLWSRPTGTVIADLQDLVSGVRQIVPLTEIGERTTGPIATTQYFLRWAGTEIPIAPSGLYRGRIALIVNEDPEEIYTFFAVSYPNLDIGRPVLRVIGSEQFVFLSNWDSAAAAREILAGPTQW